ncbi:MAG TPA: cellulase family glycosylhydrolase, partial [Pyrinomonadaceae bacterium]|nr:cellulase family glycosylhydrolase [Pyrinomonadaceae bacterium]
IVLLLSLSVFTTPKWTEQQANDWYAKQPYLVGSNFVPSSAINQLEMWQAETFDQKRIDLELKWAASLGMNTMRVFLHDLAYSQDPDGFKRRLDRFLKICDKHKIKPMLVLFDSVWDPNPKIGKQRAPRPGIHNSGWVQSPSVTTLQNPAEYSRLEKYVEDVVGTFAKDSRVNSWDIWNEPDNRNGNDYAKQDAPNKIELVNKLLPQVFQWARSVNPTQPLTSGVWKGDYPNKEIFDATEQIQIDNSDIITFHSYDRPKEVEKRIIFLQKLKRPIICTEYMARPLGSTFVAILPLFKNNNIGAINWGFIEGKSQTNYPWDSWDKPYVEYQPWIWFHDVLRTDGTPYLREETDLIKRITGKTK